MATLQDVRSQNWQLSTSQTGEIVQGLDDILQCIDVILRTQRGSDPFRPDFGVDLMSYLDRPVSEAVPALVQDVQAQIERWEQRVRITRLQHFVEEGRLRLQVEWETDLGTGNNSVTI